MARRSVGLVVLFLLAAVFDAAHAMTLSAGDANIVELLQQSSDIVVGSVTTVTDGIDDRGVPYTEVTLQVAESIRGTLSGVYRFRQFGLLAPRLTADGTRKRMPAPPGFPRYQQGENVVLFLRPAAAWTGFRMPAGVTQGKFNIDAGRVENGVGNAGLFRNVRLEQDLVTEADKRLLTTAGGPLSPEAFLSFVRRAVQEHWVEGDRMNRTDRPVGPRISPRSGDDQTPAGPPAPAPQPKRLQDPNDTIALPGSR